MEKQGEAHLSPAGCGKDDLRLLLFKDPLPQQLRGGHHLVRHVLVVRQGLDKGQNGFLIAGNGGTDDYS